MIAHSGTYERIDEPLYNSRIIKIFVDYISKYYPDLDIDSVLNHAWIASYEVDDQGHWFSQWQVDRFYEILSKKTKNPNMAREAGRYAVSSTALGAAKQYVLGLMSLVSVYLFMERLYPILSRGATVKAKKLESNKVELVSTPKPGISEKLYQCENRIGMFEALAKWFTRTFAKVEHPACFHRGDDCCRYIITWEKTPSFHWKRLRSYALLLCTGISIFFFFVLPLMNWLMLVSLCAFLTMLFSYYSEHLEKGELAETIKTQGNAAEDLLEEINIRYNDALLIKEVGQITSMFMDTDKLFQAVIEVMEKRLNFDRGGIWLANHERTQLIWKVGYGYDRKTKDLLRTTTFGLDNPRSRGVAIQAFKKQRPFLVNNITDIEDDLSARSIEFIRRIGTQSFICVPLVYERKSFGILFVDNLRSKKPLSQSDMSLLTGVSRQIAISIHNAISYQELKESKEREQNIRKLFERYVPPSVIRRYVSGDVDLFSGEGASITSMFLDIRGFTSSTEKMNPGDVVSFLNDFFEKCSRIISDERGHINKYTGDGFLALFGAPEPLENHITMCFNAACKILDLSCRYVLGNNPMGLGIGIHTGRAILGNLGSMTKMEYTAIGDTVNTAARLQELTKQFDEYSIIMSRDTVEGIDRSHPLYQNIVNLGMQQIRGKKMPLEVFGFNPLKDYSSSIHFDESGLDPIQVIKGV